MECVCLLCCVRVCGLFKRVRLLCLCDGVWSIDCVVWRFVCVVFMWLCSWYVMYCVIVYGVLLLRICVGDFVFKNNSVCVLCVMYCAMWYGLRLCGLGNSYVCKVCVWVIVCRCMVCLCLFCLSVCGVCVCLLCV